MLPPLCTLLSHQVCSLLLTRTACRCSHISCSFWCSGRRYVEIAHHDQRPTQQLSCTACLIESVSHKLYPRVPVVQFWVCICKQHSSKVLSLLREVQLWARHPAHKHPSWPPPAHNHAITRCAAPMHTSAHHAQAGLLQHLHLQSSHVNQ